MNIHLDYGAKFVDGVNAVTYTDFEISAFVMVKQMVLGDRIERWLNK